jgi:hypothetical protein
MGGLSGAICASLYLAYVSAQQRCLIGFVFILIALALAVPLIRFQSNDAENERDHFIRFVAYQLFYAPLADSVKCSDGPVPPGYGCIPPETTLEVIDNHFGNFGITTGKGLMRTYTWAGASRSISMIPGVHGNIKELNYPMDLQSRTQRWPGFDWKMHNGVARCCSLEAVLDFKSADKAAEWIRSEENQGIPFVYRNDGLLILWSKHIEPDTLWVMVHQLLIDGQKPTHLGGAADQRIRETKLFSRVK